MSNETTTKAVDAAKAETPAATDGKTFTPRYEFTWEMAARWYSNDREIIPMENAENVRMFKEPLGLNESEWGIAHGEYMRLVSLNVHRFTKAPQTVQFRWTGISRFASFIGEDGRTVVKMLDQILEWEDYFSVVSALAARFSTNPNTRTSRAVRDAKARAQSMAYNIQAAAPTFFRVLYAHARMDALLPDTVRRITRGILDRDVMEMDDSKIRKIVASIAHDGYMLTAVHTWSGRVHTNAQQAVLLMARLREVFDEVCVDDRGRETPGGVYPDTAADRRIRENIREHVLLARVQTYFVNLLLHGGSSGSCHGF